MEGGGGSGAARFLRLPAALAAEETPELPLFPLALLGFPELVKTERLLPDEAIKTAAVLTVPEELPDWDGALK